MIFLLGLASVLFANVGLLPEQSLSLAQPFSALFILYALLRLVACISSKPSRSETLQPSERPLPRISILLPVYNEANMIDDLLRHVETTDYPRERYEVLILCEPHDTDTLTQARRVCEGRCTKQLRLFVTNGNGPKTKPNALNQALSVATGEIITVYDAEDRPHPHQLHAAATALSGDAKLGVVQAPLDYYNADHNRLTRQFALEYAALFHVWIPFLSKLGLPFPLGGTSNHIRRKALESVGGWDAHNVTEDADLSFRLATAGWSSGYITPPTREEAVSTWPSWMHQRSRWMKGYMQTWLIHANHLSGTNKISVLKRQFTLHLTVGVTLLAGLLHLPGLVLLLMAFSGLVTDWQISVTTALLGASFVIGYGAGICIGVIGAKRAKLRFDTLTFVLMPIYWLALFPATLRALWELWRQPFHWNKTDHGVTGPADFKRASTHVT